MTGYNNYKKINKYNKYNKIIIKSFIFTILFVCLFNYLVNPFNIFTQHIFKRSLLKPEAKIQERLTKPIVLKIKKEKIDAIFMGSSRTDLAIATNYYKKSTNKNAENIAIGGLNTIEIEEMIDIALKTHPEIKNIYIELNYSSFLSDTNVNDFRSEITINPKVTMDELGVSFISFKTLTNSAWSIIKTISGVKTRMYYSTGEKYIFKNPEIEQEFYATWREYNTKYKLQKYDVNKTKRLIQYIQKLKEDGKNVQFFVFPSHISEFYLIYANNHQESYENWKKEFTKITPIYDFQYPNKITMAKICPEMNTYFDASHATYLVGNKMIDDMLNCNNEKHCEFAQYMSNNNADRLNKQNYSKMQKWIKNNTDIIQKINTMNEK